MDLYDDYNKLPEKSRIFIERVIANGNYGEICEHIREEEQSNKELLLEFQEEYPGVTNSDNVDEIITVIRKRQKKG